MKHIRKGSSHLIKSMMRIIALSPLLMNGVNPFGQIDPIKVSQTLPIDLNVCSDSSALEVYAVVWNSAADDITVKLRLPPRTFCVPGSNAVIPVLAYTALSITEFDNSNSNRRIFELSQSDLNLEDSLVFVFTRYADYAFNGFKGDIVHSLTKEVIAA